MARFSSVFQHKERICEQTYLVVFQTDSSSLFTPGQFATIEVAPKQYRSYSYVEICQNSPAYLTKMLPSLANSDQFYHVFLISTKAGGIASNLFEVIQPGHQCAFMSPLGKFTLSTQTSKAKNFICTGTGLAPFIPMVKQSRANDADVPIKVFFGTSNDVGDFGRRFFAEFENDPNFAMYTGMFPVKIDVETEYVKNGTVTQIFPTVVTDIASEEYYLCGNPFMIADVKNVLAAAGATDVFSEIFGSVAPKKPLN